MVQYLDKLNDMSFAKAMRCEEKSQRCAAEPVGNELEEALSIQSESALLTLHPTTIQQQRDDHDVTLMCKEVSSAVLAKPDPVMREGTI